MKWKVLFKSMFYSIVIVSIFLTFIEYSLDFLGYNTYSIDLMADIFPPLIFIVSLLFIATTTILYQLMRL